MKDAETEFARCTEHKLMKDGTLEIHCKLGLWSVSGADYAAVEQEARSYWWQYFVDGEYRRREHNLLELKQTNRKEE